MSRLSGFADQHAEHTCASRIRILADLGFIDLAEGPIDPIGYVLIYKSVPGRAGHIVRQRPILLGGTVRRQIVVFYVNSQMRTTDTPLRLTPFALVEFPTNQFRTRLRGRER